MRNILWIVGLVLLSYVIVCLVWAFLMTLVVIVDGSSRLDLGDVVGSFVMGWFVTLLMGGAIWEIGLDPRILWMFDVLCVFVTVSLLFLLYKRLIPKLDKCYWVGLAVGVTLLLLLYINTIKPAPDHNGEGSTAPIGRVTEGGLFKHWVWLGERSVSF